MGTDGEPRTTASQ